MSTRQARTLRRAPSLEVRLFPREALVLAVGAFGVAGLVFGFGVMVGKRLPEGEGGPPGLAAVDETADEHRIRTFDFFHTLAPSPDKPVERNKPAKAAPAKPAPAKPDAAKPEDAKPEPEPKPEPKPEVVAPPERSRVAAAKEELPAGLPPLPAKGDYTLQIASYRGLEEAKARTEELRRDHALTAFIRTVTIPGKGTWYRVRLGQFATQVDADRYRELLQQRTGLSAWVTQAAQ